MAKAFSLDQPTYCSICRETFMDPRSLPCGHCYCGPPRVCLNSMQNQRHELICAICRSVFKLKVTDIKPLYGIRDIFRGAQSNLDNQKRNRLCCDEHAMSECKQWCVSCDVRVCEECVEEQYDGHNLRNLRKHLVETIERKLGEEINDGLNVYLTSLEELITNCQTKFDYFSSKQTSIDQFKQESRKKQNIIRSYLELAKGDFKSSKSSDQLLFDMFCMDFALPCSSETIEGKKSSFTQSDIKTYVDKSIQVSIQNPADVFGQCIHDHASLQYLELKYHLKVNSRKPLNVQPSCKMQYGNVFIQISASVNPAIFIKVD